MIKEQKQQKIWKKAIFALTFAVACNLLIGCATSQTLLAQMGAAGLPEKVARKLYGYCPDCQNLVNQGYTVDGRNCPNCAAIRADRRAGSQYQTATRAQSYQPYHRTPSYGYTTNMRSTNTGYLNARATGMQVASTTNNKANPYGYRQNSDGTWKTRTKRGNRYPAWVHPNSKQMNSTIAHAQADAVNSDQELAIDYFDFLRWASHGTTELPRESSKQTPQQKRYKDPYATLGY